MDGIIRLYEDLNGDDIKLEIGFTIKKQYLEFTDELMELLKKYETYPDVQIDKL